MNYWIVIPGEMLGKARPRVTRNGVYTPPETRAIADIIGWSAKEKQRAPLDGPIALQIEIETVPPLSWSARKKADAISGAIWPGTKPDLDNQVKLIMDGLNRIAWRDDCQVVRLAASKIYAGLAQTRVSWGPA